jgi:hypothetical protein
MRYLVIALAALGGSIIQPATGQTMDREKFKAFLTSEVHNNLVRRALAAFPPTVFQPCPGLVSTGSKWIILKLVSFGSDGVPNAGAWKEMFPVSGCGNDTELNFYFGVDTNGKINTTIGIPGSTRADPLLQRDGHTYAFMGASVAAKTCKQFVVKNSRFEAFGWRKPPTPDPGPTARLRPWWETWTVVGCGRTFDVPMNFAPDQTGTVISQSAKDVVER